MKIAATAQVSAILLLLAVNCLAATPYHDFLLKDGRSFRGRIVDYDQHSDIVSIERADKRLVKTSPTVFDEADQVHIKEWHMVRCFKSESLFKVSAARHSFKGTRKAQSAGQLGLSSIYVHLTRYSIILGNRSSIKLRNISVEYRIYYSFKKYKGVKSGKAYVAGIEPRSKKELETIEIITRGSSNYN
ncbi:MAG: hypothetical protein KAU94_11710, partial [Verrucomicrobia bacterium]|nr:hypothetical protein [Verrucomicrobiota bacterium]